ncbi:MAG: hypothetical protein Q9191_003319 [Dirinaria sp. TL-2023a]
MDVSEPDNVLSEDAEKQLAETSPHKSHSPKPPFPLIHETAFVIVLCSTQLLTQASLGNTITPLHIISKSFGTTDPGELSWWMGPATMLPNAVAILGRTYPQGRRKEMVFSLFGATAPWGFIVGSGFASTLTEHVGWSWGYYCLAIACCVGGFVAFFVIPQQHQDNTIDRSFDYAGSITGVAGLVLLNVSWNQAPVVGWSTPYVYILLILGFCFLFAFSLIERKVSVPLIPFEAFSPKVAFVLGCVALGWSSFGIWLFYLWQFLELLRGVSPRTSAAMSIPTGISGLCAAVTTGFLLSRMRPEYIMTIALLAFCVGNVLVATAPVSQSYWIQTFLSLVITPWGMDMSFPAGTLILSDTMPKEHQGLGASLVNTIVNYSISLGLGIAGTVEVHVNRNGDDTLRGFRGAWYAGIGLSGLGVALALLFIVNERAQRRDS